MADILGLLQLLARLGIPVSQLGGAPGEVGSALGLLGSGLGLVRGAQSGDPVSAIGGALGAGRQAANLLGEPLAGSALGALGGPLAIGNAIAQGNPAGAISAIPSTVSAGANLAGSAGLLAPELAGSISSIAGAFAPYLAMTLLPAMYDTRGDDFFDMLFGNGRDRLKETRTAPGDFTRDLGAMAAGAGTLGQTSDTPEGLLNLLKTAQSGIDTRSSFGHNFDVLKHGTAYAPGQDMSQIEAVTPALSGANWRAWTDLMDQATKRGVNTDTVVGQDYRTRALDQGTAKHDTPGDNSLPVSYGGQPGYSTPEANDLSQAIYGELMAQGKGITGGLPGATGAGGYLAPDQLAGFGLTPGHYKQGILDYIAQMGNLPAYQEPPQASPPPEIAWQGGSGGGDAA